MELIRSERSIDPFVIQNDDGSLFCNIGNGGGAIYHNLRLGYEWYEDAQGHRSYREIGIGTSYSNTNRSGNVWTSHRGEDSYPGEYSYANADGSRYFHFGHGNGAYYWTPSGYTWYEDPSGRRHYGMGYQEARLMMERARL